MLVVETIGKIRRAYFAQGKPIKAICRELKVSRKVVRKVLRSGATEFTDEREVQPLPKIGPWKTDLERILVANAAKPARERLTLMRVFEELRGLGYQGGYDTVRRYARSWHREQAATSAAAFVPLSFAPGEAYQFDWSHEVVLIDGTTVIVKVAHVRLCHSRMLFVRAYPRETQEPPRSADRGPFGIGLERLLTIEGLRRPRPGVRLLQGCLHARHLRQHEDSGGDDLRRQGAPLQSPLPADVQPLPGRSGRLHAGLGPSAVC
jgi:transposase